LDHPFGQAGQTGSETSVTKVGIAVKPRGRMAASQFVENIHLLLGIRLLMCETAPQSAPLTTIPTEQAQEIRRLAHDLSNALEVILQTSYLLGTLPLDANGQQWHGMLDKGVRQAAAINQQLREYLRQHC
jgi:hypothetical protein